MVQKAHRLVANAFKLRPKRQISICRFFSNSVVFYYFFRLSFSHGKAQTLWFVSFLARDLAEIRDFSHSCVKDLGKLLLLSLAQYLVRWVTKSSCSGVEF